ncbi:MAG: PP2C family protein-serine/threonine phosphatase [Spirochaetota bacterium]
MNNSVNNYSDKRDDLNIKEMSLKFNIIKQEADHVREKDKILIRELFRSFSPRNILLGIGFQRAYGSLLSGDYFDLFKLADRHFMFVFSDISGHGLPAYTTLIRLRSAIILAVMEMQSIHARTGIIDYPYLIKSIAIKFTDIMDHSNSSDFASVNFVFLQESAGEIKLRFFNRSMLFPIILKREGDQSLIYNLNNEFKGWKPRKGYLLGSDIKHVTGEDDYYFTPECVFEVKQGDKIFFYTDGITEAFDHKTERSQYGEARLEQKLLEMTDLPPQLIVNNIFDSVYEFIGNHENQKDDMTAVIVDLPYRV